MQGLISMLILFMFATTGFADADVETLDADISDEMMDTIVSSFDAFYIDLQAELGNEFVNDFDRGEITYESLNEQERHTFRTILNSLEKEIEDKTGLELRDAVLLYDDSRLEAAIEAYNDDIVPKGTEDEEEEGDEENPEVPKTGDGSAMMGGGDGFSSMSYLLIGLLILAGGIYYYEVQRA